jgi:tRNA(fMet)-specific endonuclease VapC
MKYLLDTNVFIHAAKNAGHVRQELAKHPPTRLATSVITLAELLYGAAKSADPRKTASDWLEVLAPYHLVEFDKASAIEHPHLRFQLKHQPIGERDLLIASMAVAHKLTLVSHNLAEFQRVPGLHCEDWF